MTKTQIPELNAEKETLSKEYMTIVEDRNVIMSWYNDKMIETAKTNAEAYPGVIIERNGKLEKIDKRLREIQARVRDINKAIEDVKPKVEVKEEKEGKKKKGKSKKKDEEESEEVESSDSIDEWL